MVQTYLFPHWDHTMLSKRKWNKRLSNPVGTRHILDVYFASNSRFGNTRIRKHVYYTSFLRPQNTRIFLDVLYTSNIRVDKCRLILVCIRRLKCVYFKLNLDVAFISKCLSFVFIYSSKNIFALFFCFYNPYFSGIFYTWNRPVIPTNQLCFYFAGG